MSNEILNNFNQMLAQQQQKPTLQQPTINLARTATEHLNLSRIVTNSSIKNER